MDDQLRTIQLLHAIARARNESFDLLGDHAANTLFDRLLVRIFSRTNVPREAFESIFSREFGELFGADQPSLH